MLSRWSTTDSLAHLLLQVLLNLMQNAARFTKQGFVCVRCTAEQAPGGRLSANFGVLDSGSGMSDATKATLFDLYSSVGGIGLGMFLSGKLLSLLGSKIEVESPWRSDGPGAAFYFSIDMAMAPVAPAASGLEKESEHARALALEGRVEDLANGVLQPGQAAVPDTPPNFESNLRVLVADDGQTNRRLLCRAFTGYFGQGWSVTEASSAEEALSLATETEFALIVMDEIFAPGLDAMRGSAAIIDLRAHEARSGAARRSMMAANPNPDPYPDPDPDPDPVSNPNSNPNPNPNQGRDRLLHGECAVVTGRPEELGGRPGVGEADAQLHKQRDAERACAPAGCVFRTCPAAC